MRKYIKKNVYYLYASECQIKIETYLIKILSVNAAMLLILQVMHFADPVGSSSKRNYFNFSQRTEQNLYRLEAKTNTIMKICSQ